MHSTTKGWDNQLAELRYLEDDVSIMDEASICAKVLGKTAGTIFGIGPAPRKSYSRAYTASSSSRFVQELETLTQRINEKDNTITELTQRLEQQALLIQGVAARMV
ncbi:hypothetical protein FNV43_RR08219 [Rhamnella rubrinervis]|uniref:Uncharacterized protein n=1 Tax=Rhamnella rubrinervis TaxID=2594499 RepID=A0A8K0MN25_9ROSA|nr:hypothetical protein FNV43_RR08219 [Rhamnella rubrinervis]